MKKISGKILSSKPISLSNAAASLAAFVSTDTGASQAVSAYLRRASMAFIELSQLHKELKAFAKSEGKQKRHWTESTAEIADRSVEVSQGVRQGELRQGRDRLEIGDSVGVESERKKHKKDAKKDVSDEFRDNEREIRKEVEVERKLNGSVEFAQELSHGIEGNAGLESEMKKHKKNKKNKKDEFGNNGVCRVDVGENKSVHRIGVEEDKRKEDKASVNGEGKLADSGELRSKRKGRAESRIINHNAIGEEECLAKITIKEETRDGRKKRKSGEMGEGQMDGSQQPSKKKRRKRTEGDNS